MIYLVNYLKQGMPRLAVVGSLDLVGAMRRDPNIKVNTVTKTSHGIFMENKGNALYQGW